MSDQGFLYCARGDRWLIEAERSAASIKAVMPQAAVAIVADKPMPQHLFDIQIAPPPSMHVKSLKMWAMRHSPFARTVFIDTDTFVCDPVPELFTILDRFPLAAAITPFWTVELQQRGGVSDDDGIPISFPKLNSGLVAQRKDAETDAFLDFWSARHTETGLKQDQQPFRYALYHTDIRFAALPMAYNYRLPYPGAIGGGVKILHGRVPDMAGLAKRLNRTSRWRITAPLNRVARQIWYGVDRTQ